MSSRRRRIGAAVAALSLAAMLAAVSGATQEGVAVAGREVRAASGDVSIRDAARDPVRGQLWIEMRNVDLRIDGSGALRIQRLRGEVISTVPGEPAVLDDPRTFSIRVTSGTVALTGADLSALLNGVVFNYRGAPLKRIKVRTEGDHIVQSGTLYKGVPMKFEITASLSLEPDGRVRLHPTRTRILGVDGKKLMRALGLHLDDLLDLRKARGVTVKGDDLFLEPTAIVPPPMIAGRLTSIRVEGDRIIQEFARLPDDTVYDSYVRPDSTVPNFVYFRGGQLRFGKLLMTDTDLLIADRDPRDAFDLFLPEYNRQLVAGTSRTLPNLGLAVSMPDYASLDRSPNR